MNMPHVLFLKFYGLSYYIWVFTPTGVSLPWGIPHPTLPLPQLEPSAPGLVIEDSIP